MIQQLSSSSGHLLARQPSLGLPLTPAQALAASTNSQSGQLMMAALTSALQDPVLGQYRTPEEQRDLVGPRGGGGRMRHVLALL
jgi:hypothetical protein